MPDNKDDIYYRVLDSIKGMFKAEVSKKKTKEEEELEAEQKRDRDELKKLLGQ